MSSKSVKQRSLSIAMLIKVQNPIIYNRIVAQETYRTSQCDRLVDIKAFFLLTPTYTTVLCEEGSVSPMLHQVVSHRYYLIRCL